MTENPPVPIRDPEPPDPKRPCMDCDTPTSETWGQYDEPVCGECKRVRATSALFRAAGSRNHSTEFGRRLLAKICKAASESVRRERGAM